MFDVDAPETKDYKRKLKVILWKCYKMCKNNLAISLIELSTPIALFLLIYFVQKSGYLVESFVDTDTFYDSQNLLVPPIFDITYAPNTSDVNDFMNSVQSSISGGKVELDGYQTEDDVRMFIERKVNNNTENKKIIGVLFNNFYKDCNVLNYRILAECYRNGMDLAYQTDPPYATSWSEDYNISGFLVLQKAIDFTFIDKKGKGKSPNIKLEKMPTPPHKLENKILNIVIYFIIPISFTLLFLSFMPMIITEKSFGTKQIMIVMGLEPWQYWFGWYLYSAMAYFFTVAITAILFTINFHDNIVTPFDHSNGFIVWFFILCFFTSTVCFIFFFSAILSDVNMSGLIMIIWLIPVYLVAYISPEKFPVAVMGLCMFMPSFTYAFGMVALLGYERIGGVHFSNMFSKPNMYSKSPSFGLIIFMLILDSFIYFGLAWYVAYVWPGQFGVPKPWNFLFKKSFWRSTQEDDRPKEVQLAPLEKKPEIEPVSGFSAGIQIRDLVKTYGYKNAVDGLNIDIYNKQITVLLGHNGAGKTTAISMITGMIYPTQGIITINGYDVHKNYNAVRQHLGLCLQHNIEISGLSVMNHLIYFGLLRGRTLAETKQEALDFLKMANMEDKANSQISDLSGGMKRKVSIGMATIGKSKVVLLDEPTSGLDPQARRDLWDFLLAMRGERSILITTHYMEEAEVLGDRIAIMHSGQLICYGTSLFLKKLYSTGYKLTVIVENPESNDVNGFVRSYVSGASFKSSKGGCLVFSLPTNDNKVLSGLVQALDYQKKKLGVLNYGIKNASLEEVFIKVGEIADANKGATLKINQNQLNSDGY